jgi:hypothetical protein
MNPMTETFLRFSGEWPLWPVVGVATLAGLAMWFLYGRERKAHPGTWSWVPGGCRSLVVFLLVMAMAGPVLRHETVKRQLGRVILAVEASESMRLTDGESDKTRWQRVEDMLFQGEKPLVKQLMEDSDVELVALRGKQLQRLWWHRAGGKDSSGEMPKSLGLSPNAPLTDLDATLRQSLGGATAGSALVVLTDGQHNAGGSPEEMSAALKASAVPLFAVGLGAEVSPPDMSVVEVVAPESVFGEEVMRGRVMVSDRMPEGLPATVRVEGPAGLVMWEQAFTTTGKGDRRFDFSFPVKGLPAPVAQDDKSLRLCSVSVRISGDKASLEKTRANNAAELAFHVMDKKRKLLVLDGRARWETRYIHNHFERDENWDVTLAFDNYEPGNGNSIATAFPKTKDELFGHDLVVLGDLAPGRIGEEQMKWLKAFVEERGGGLVLIDGARGGLKSLAKGPTASLIPVTWVGEQTAVERLTWTMEREAERYPALRLSDSPSANATLWPTLPVARWGAAVSALPGAVTLSTLKNEAGVSRPAIVFRNAGAGAVLYLASDELWRWRYQVADLYHQRLWVQLASWIAAPPFQVEAGRLAIGTDRLRFRSGEQAELRVRLKDAQGKLSSQGQPRAFLLLDGKEVATMEMEPDPTHVGVFRAITPPLKPGQWQVSVAEGPTAPRSDIRLSLRVADGGNSELSALTMNRVLLETMARNTGGRFLREEQVGGLPSLLQLVDRKQVSVSETLLWSSWWWLGAVIFLLTVEWLMRRALRLV